MIEPFIIREDVFKTNTLFLFGCDILFFKNYLKRKYNIDEEIDGEKIVVEDYQGVAGAMFTYEYKKSTLRAVWVEDINRNKTEDLGTLVHELSHLVIAICDDRGVPISSRPFRGGHMCETPSYLLEYFFTECLKKLKKK